ncbi:hypothetical protein B0H13DRAFT_1026221 [Mycena leptocephala]|nr:hypothetical protein B0H13DRAFT_1026221 [Mycena leptocephala]
MNARLLVHNPVTGEPGSINGHASVQLHAAPSNQHNWDLEVPYVSDSQIQSVLTNYGTGIHREVSRQRRQGTYRLTISRRILQDESSDTEPVVSEGWHRSLSPPAPIPAVPAVGEGVQAISPASRYVIHPDGMPPPFDISNMQEIGRTLIGDHVLRFPEIPADESTINPIVEHPGTPRLPRQLLYDCPALRINETPVLEDVLDDEGSPDALINDWLPADPSTWTPAGCSPEARWTSTNDRVERVSYDARVCLWRTEEENAKLPKLVFSNFIMPTGSIPTSSLPTGTTNDVQEGEEREEGQIDEVAPPLDPRLRSRANHVVVPAIETGQRGVVIDLPPHAEPSPSPLRLSHPRSSWTTADFVSEAERLIHRVVHHIGADAHLTSDNGSDLPSLPPSLPSTPDPISTSNWTATPFQTL